MGLLNEKELRVVDDYVRKIETGNVKEAQLAGQQLSNFVNEMVVADKREEALGRVNKTNREHVAALEKLGLPPTRIQLQGSDTDGDLKIDKLEGMRLEGPQSKYPGFPSGPVEDKPSALPKRGGPPERGGPPSILPDLYRPRKASEFGGASGSIGGSVAKESAESIKNSFEKH